MAREGSRGEGWGKNRGEEKRGEKRGKEGNRYDSVLAKDIMCWGFSEGKEGEGNNLI